jgi:hypothetical protein
LLYGQKENYLRPTIEKRKEKKFSQNLGIGDDYATTRVGYGVESIKFVFP